MLPYMVISEAVRKLRMACGESQQTFSNRLVLSISSIAHYEWGQRSPDYAVTLGLYRAACDVGRKDLASYFLQMINAGMVARVVVPVQSEDERSKIRALQAILHDSQFGHLRMRLADLLAPVEAYLRRTEAAQQAESIHTAGVAEELDTARRAPNRKRKEKK